MTRIGLYGGTFDPPHLAHLTLAEWVRKKLILDRLYFIPAAIHAFKHRRQITPPDLRLKMVGAAVQNHPFLFVSSIELERPGISYTVDTLKNFKTYENITDVDLYYIIGSDNLTDFKRWKEPDRILDLATLVVIRRPGFENLNKKSLDQKKMVFLESPLIDISATEIREKVRKGEDIAAIVPSEVEKIIHQHRLYHSGPVR